MKTKKKNKLTYAELKEHVFTWRSLTILYLILILVMAIVMMHLLSEKEDLQERNEALVKQIPKFVLIVNCYDEENGLDYTLIMNLTNYKDYLEGYDSASNSEDCEVIN